MLGLDCIVIVGTGAGKTMPFGMPLLMDKASSKMVIVISPLNDLEAEQVSMIALMLSHSLINNLICLGCQILKFGSGSRHRCVRYEGLKQRCLETSLDENIEHVIRHTLSDA